MSETSSTVGLRERKKRQTRDRLMEAAFALFEERGFDQVSVAEIADHADVSERTFFRYFPSKEAVIFGNAAEDRAHVADLVANLPHELSLVDGLRSALMAISSEFEEAKELHMARARLVASTPSLQTLVLFHEQSWVESFAGAIADRLGTDQKNDQRPELIAAVMVAVFRVVMERWTRGGGEGDIRQRLDQALEFLGSGLDVDKPV